MKFGTLNGQKCKIRQKGNNVRPPFCVQLPLKFARCSPNVTHSIALREDSNLTTPKVQKRGTVLFRNSPL